MPVLGSDFVDYKAEFSTGKSLTPGQGQTVDIAGVPVGEIGNVELKDGRALVTMKIRRKYTPIYKDATALLRPKTGLEDMIIELTPGSKSAGVAPARLRRSRCDNTLPDVKLDEVLAQLDTDTRDYLKLLVSGAGQGLKGQGKQLSADFRRFDPTARDLAKLNGQLAKRRVQHPPVDPQLPRRHRGAGRARTSKLTELVDVLQRRVQVAGRRGRGAAQRAAAAARRRCATPRRRWARPTRSRASLGPTLQGLRPAARALGAVAARDAAVPEDDHADHPRPAAARSPATRGRRSARCGPRPATWPR